MGFLRRFLGGGRDAAGSPGVPDDSDDSDGSDGSDGSDEAEQTTGSADLDAEERSRELELARFEQDRVDDLVRRQQRYADRSWTPPAQGGERRADDEEPAKR